jgi:multiple antibiotic resistance protein
MSSFWTYTLVCFASLFSIVDPLSAVPIFLGLVGEQDRATQGKTALRASFTVLVVLSTFAAAGSTIFGFFGITIPAFKIAGGVLLFAVALEMMRARPSGTRGTPEEQREAASKDDVGLIPLGLPLLSGPGAIATVMVLVGRSTTSSERVSVYASILALSVVTFLVLRSAAVFARALGKTGINVIGRIMGLILAAISVQFVVDGLREAFPKLLG